MKHVYLRRSPILALAALAAMAAAPARAEVAIDVDLSTQTMHVRSATASYDWAVSTARQGFSTPRGRYGVQSLQAMHYSRLYHNSPMPHSIFFNGGYAIHGTYATGALGAPASHGCVRLSPGHAGTLFDLVRAEGAEIQIHGRPPFGRAPGELSVAGDTPVFHALHALRRAARPADVAEADYDDAYAEPAAPRPRSRSVRRYDDVQYIPSFVPGPDGYY